MPQTPRTLGQELSTRLPGHRVRAVTMMRLTRRLPIRLWAILRDRWEAGAILPIRLEDRLDCGIGSDFGKRSDQFSRFDDGCFQSRTADQASRSVRTH